MKLNSIIIEALFCIGILCACEKSETATEQTDDGISDYTVMVYGCGGGDLDRFSLRNLLSMMEFGATDKVKAIWQFNMSAKWQRDFIMGETEEEDRYEPTPFAGTMRLILPEGPHYAETSPSRTRELIDELAASDLGFFKAHEDSVLDLSKPETLTAFIDWAAAECPAKNYILVLSDHGQGWTIKNESPMQTKAILSDNNTGTALKLADMIKGISDSKASHLLCIYTDACQMGCVENLTAYSNVADFFVGSSCPAASEGGNFRNLLNLLNGIPDGRDDLFFGAMADYCSTTALSWGIQASDVAVTDLRHMSEINAEIKKWADFLVAHGTDQQEIFNESVRKSLQYYGHLDYPIVDLISFFKNISDLCILDDMPSWYDLDDMLTTYKFTARTPGCLAKGIDISLGINLMSAQEFAVGASLYEALDFDKATGWSRWLKVNTQTLDGNPAVQQQGQALLPT